MNKTGTNLTIFKIKGIIYEYGITTYNGQICDEYLRRCKKNFAPIFWRSHFKGSEEIYDFSRSYPSLMAIKKPACNQLFLPLAIEKLPRFKEAFELIKNFGELMNEHRNT